MVATSSPSGVSSGRVRASIGARRRALVFLANCAQPPACPLEGLAIVARPGPRAPHPWDGVQLCNEERITAVVSQQTESISLRVHAALASRVDESTYRIWLKPL